jgi:hypothetical protein
LSIDLPRGNRDGVHKLPGRSVRFLGVDQVRADLDLARVRVVAEGPEVTGNLDGVGAFVDQILL